MQERPGRIEYLYLTEEQAERSEELNVAIDNMEPGETLRCQVPQQIDRKTSTENPEYFTGFPHVDYNETAPPSPGEAWLMCATAGVMCPVAKQCLAFAEALEPPFGVWGGRVFEGGVPVYDTPRRTNNG